MTSLNLRVALRQIEMAVAWGNTNFRLHPHVSIFFENGHFFRRIGLLSIHMKRESFARVQGLDYSSNGIDAGLLSYFRNG